MGWALENLLLPGEKAKMPQEEDLSFGVPAKLVISPTHLYYLMGLMAFPEAVYYFLFI